jgi:hypothetical protein
MSERLKGIRRVQAVQAKIRDLAAWKLGAIERRQAELATARTAVEAFIASEGPTGALAGLADGTVRRLAGREAAVERQRIAVAGAAREAESRLKLADRLVDGIARDERDAQERRRLEDLVEMMLGRAGGEPRSDGEA